MYFTVPDREHYKVAFSDLDENQKVLFLNRGCVKLTRLLNRVDRFLKWGGVNIVKRMLYAVYPYQTLVRKNGEHYLCFTDSSYKEVNKEYLCWLKRKYPKVKIVLLLYNKVALLYNRPGNEQLQELPDQGKSLCSDYVFTYDPDDAKILGIPYFEIYSKIDELNKEAVKYDIFYLGDIKYKWKSTRYDLLKEIYNYLCQKNVSCDFHLHFGEQLSELECEFKEDKMWSYMDILKRDLQANVILEVVSDGKYGPTFRYCEAVVYGIKLLTNNPHITELPFYNPKYMRFFSKIEDIDIAWVKRKEKVDYSYYGEFSPKALWKQLENYSGDWKKWE